GTLFIRPLDRKSPNLAEKGVLAHLLILHQGSRLLPEAEFIQQQREKSIPPRVVVKIINRFCVIIWMIIIFSLLFRKGPIKQQPNIIAEACYKERRFICRNKIQG